MALEISIVFDILHPCDLHQPYSQQENELCGHDPFSLHTLMECNDGLEVNTIFNKAQASCMITMKPYL